LRFDVEGLALYTYVTSSSWRLRPRAFDRADDYFIFWLFYFQYCTL